MTRRARSPLCIAILGSILACDTPRAGDADVLLARVARGTVTAPDTVRAGWRRLRVVEDGRGHILVLFRLAPDAGAPDVARFLAALDTAVTTPAPALALGGPEVGDSGEVLIEVAPGTHVIACVRRGADGHRHGSTGESKTIVVVSGAPADTARAPAQSQDLAMVDFAYAGPERWDVGVRMLRVENRGHHEHQVRIARLRPGVTLRQWLEAEDAPGVDSTVAGVARLGPGATAYLPVDLAVGSYVLYCLITDPATDKPHVELGMFKAIEVTTGSAR